MQKLYEILDLPLGTNKSQLKKKYRKLAFKYHPDKGGDEEKFKEITLAYEILSGKRKPNRHETAKYGDVVQPVRRPARTHPINHPRPDLDPNSQKTTVWPPPHLKTYWKNASKESTKAAWDDTKSRVVNDFSSKMYPGVSDVKSEVPVYCAKCSGLGKELRTCTKCYGTGNIVASESPIPSAVRKCYICNGKGKESIGECLQCKGSGKHVKSS